MSIIFILVIIGVLVAGGFLLAFIWAVKSGQYEDSYSPSVRILFDDHIKEPEREQSDKENTNHKKDSNNKE
ncbi:MAG: cbb3-type cytochrome oxidase assembly protein CcoS [Bacteroidetes bacterium]|nr:MAG: cbb3-type cytochrome oxidase assembly protein CcoS [Bacteroidota bacterium]